MLAIPAQTAVSGPLQVTGPAPSTRDERPTQRAQTETGPPPYEPPAPPVSLDSGELAATEPRTTVFEMAFGSGKSGHAENLTVASALSDAERGREVDQASLNQLAERVQSPEAKPGSIDAARDAEQARGRAAEQAYAEARAAADFEVPPILSKAV